MRIALLDDAHATRSGHVAEVLRNAGHSVALFPGLMELLAAPAPRRFDLLAAPARVLAGHQPAHEVAALRSGGVQVLAIAAQGECEALAAIDADDYLVEPFGHGELALRVDVLARRARLATPPQVAAPPYEFRADTREALLRGRPVPLTAREFELALYLFRRVGHAIPRGEIAERVWGRIPPASRTLDAHVSSLRRKLALEPANGYRLAAHYGHGYCLTPVPGTA